MPHQCTYCSKVFPDASEELLKGCSCGGRFFYYIRQEKYEELKNQAKAMIVELEKADVQKIEKDIRELTGLTEEPDKPVILDLESIRVISPGKFEIDIVNLFYKKKPVIYKLSEGKYIIDLASSLYKLHGDKDEMIDSFDENEKIQDEEISENNNNEKFENIIGEQ